MREVRSERAQPDQGLEILEGAARPQESDTCELNPISKFDESIFIGKMHDAKDPELLKRHGIRSILSLNGDTIQATDAPECIEKITVFHFTDGPGNDSAHFERAVDSFRDHLQNHAPVLIHCHAGRSRTPVLLAGYLVKYQGKSIDEALTIVKSRRDTNISQGLISLLSQLGSD